MIRDEVRKIFDLAEQELDSIKGKYAIINRISFTPNKISIIKLALEKIGAGIKVNHNLYEFDSGFDIIFDCSLGFLESKVYKYTIRAFAAWTTTDTSVRADFVYSVDGGEVVTLEEVISQIEHNLKSKLDQNYFKISFNCNEYRILQLACEHKLFKDFMLRDNILHLTYCDDRAPSAVRKVNEIQIALSVACKYLDKAAIELGGPGNKKYMAEIPGRSNIECSNMEDFITTLGMFCGAYKKS